MSPDEAATGGATRLLSLAAVGCLVGGMVAGVGALVLAVLFVLAGAWGAALVTAVAGVGFGVIHHVLGLSGSFTAEEHAKQWRSAASPPPISLPQSAALLVGGLVLAAGVILPLAGVAAALVVAFQDESWWAVAFVTGGIPCGTLLTLLGFGLVGAVQDRRLALAR